MRPAPGSGAAAIATSSDDAPARPAGQRLLASRSAVLAWERYTPLCRRERGQRGACSGSRGAWATLPTHGPRLRATRPPLAARSKWRSPSSAPNVPKQQSATVIHGHQRPAIRLVALRRRLTADRPRVLPKLAVSTVCPRCSHSVQTVVSTCPPRTLRRIATSAERAAAPTEASAQADTPACPLSMRASTQHDPASSPRAPSVHRPDSDSRRSPRTAATSGHRSVLGRRTSAPVSA